MPSTKDVLADILMSTLPEDVPVYKIEPIKYLGMTIPHVVIFNQSGYQSIDPRDGKPVLISNWLIEITDKRREENKIEQLARTIMSIFRNSDSLSGYGIFEIRLININDIRPLDRSAIIKKELIFQTTEEYP